MKLFLKSEAVARLREMKRPIGLTGRRYNSVLDMLRGEGADPEMVERVKELIEADDRLAQIRRILSFAGFGDFE